MTVIASKPLLKEPKIYSLQDYLQREERALHKNEFYNGQIIRMPGGKLKHNAIASNALTALKNAIKTLDKKYWAINSDQKIYIEAVNIAVYPDALVISEKPEYYQTRKDLITNPLLIVEVASDSTRAYDRGAKFMHYRSLPSFKEYVLIEQNSNQVEVWFKERENTWTIKTETDITASILMQSIGISISLSDIYEDTAEL
jgi:Uma2 family endonuclease